MSERSQNQRNQLSESRSPYLLQHADNPVHWMEWGEQAFELARERDLPIFLSIGYSTCHWCHVMAHESFEDEHIAHRMNELFVNVKLDREERPDVDRIYMSYVQATTGSGGWPMSVWLTPDLKPFYGGTYFPPEDRYGRVGFMTLIKRIGELWREDRVTLIEYGEKSVALLSDNADRELGGQVAEAADAIDKCLEQLDTDFDPEWGGFGRAPKFPMHGYHKLLIEGVSRLGNARLTELLVETLVKQAEGGIWDHVGSGFHRYSVDRYWHVPHFEKMLYDQGQLAGVYADAYRLTGRSQFREVAERIVDYVSRDLMGADGELFAAEDADSPLPEDPSKHGEGAFYVWGTEELDSILGVDAELFKAAFGCVKEGNARPEADPHGELKGRNTLMRWVGDKELCNRFGLEEKEAEARLRKSLELLFEKRIKRPRPHLDDKSLTSWSGLMISGACRVYQACGYEGALSLGKKAYTFLRERMWDGEAKALYRVFRKNRGSQRGFAEDYAALALACLDLYECTFEVSLLSDASEYLAALDERFLDTERGGYFATEKGDGQVLVRLRDDYDGAEPSASSLATMAQMKLAGLVKADALRQRARETIEAFGEQWKATPRAMPLMLVAASRFLEADQQIVVVGKRQEGVTQALLACANRWRSPGSCLIFLDKEATLAEDFRGNESLQAMLDATGGDARAFVCEDFACREPVGSADALEALLK